MGSSILVEANLFLAIKLQPDLIIRAILRAASILRSKLKIEIERKFYCNATLCLSLTMQVAPCFYLQYRSSIQ